MVILFNSQAPFNFSYLILAINVNSIDTSTIFVFISEVAMAIIFEDDDIS